MATRDTRPPAKHRVLFAESDLTVHRFYNRPPEAARLEAVRQRPCFWSLLLPG